MRLPSLILGATGNAAQLSTPISHSSASTPTTLIWLRVTLPRALRNAARQPRATNSSVAPRNCSTLLNAQLGIRKNVVSSVPAIEPNVESAYKRPATPPTPASELAFNFTEYGETMPI